MPPAVNFNLVAKEVEIKLFHCEKRQRSLRVKPSLFTEVPLSRAAS